MVTRRHVGVTAAHAAGCNRDTRAGLRRRQVVLPAAKTAMSCNIGA